jgi:hypothetical protein
MLSPEQHRVSQALANQSRAAWTFGMLIAQGRMTREDVLPVLIATARQTEPTIPEPLVRSTMADLLRDRVNAWVHVRDLVRGRIWRALDPLVAARQPARSMLAAAHRINAEAEQPPGAPWKPWSYLRPLAKHEVTELVRRKLDHTMREMQREAKAT